MNVSLRIIVLTEDDGNTQYKLVGKNSVKKVKSVEKILDFFFCKKEDKHFNQ